MQANWSLILNVLLLIGVIVAIGRLMKARKQGLSSERYPSSVSKAENSPYDAQPYHDDIISVRKVNKDISLGCEPEVGLNDHALNTSTAKSQKPQLMPQEKPQIASRIEKKVSAGICSKHEANTASSDHSSSTLMMFLLAKENRQFAGYELLQTVLASGLRFGEGHLFHKHQHINDQHAILCSLAAATSTGIFDLQNIGAFSVRGLCLYMSISNIPQIDAERFSVMLDTAKQLSEGLDAYLLDDQRKPLTKERIERYLSELQITSDELEYAIA